MFQNDMRLQKNVILSINSVHKHIYLPISYKSELENQFLCLQNKQVITIKKVSFQFKFRFVRRQHGLDLWS